MHLLQDIQIRKEIIIGGDQIEDQIWLLPAPDLRLMIPHFLALVSLIHLNHDDGELLSSILQDLYRECTFPKVMDDPVEFMDTCILPIMRFLNLRHVFDIPIQILSTGCNEISNYKQKRTIRPDERTGYLSVQPKESMQEAINYEMSTVISDTHSFQEYYVSVKHISLTYNNCKYSNPEEHEEYLHNTHMFLND